MAQRLDVKPLPPFDPTSEPSSLSQRWRTWKRRFETYLVAVNVTDDKQKRALLLYQAGQETQDLFETFSDTGTDYETAIDKLDAYFNPKKNVDFEVFQFRQATQREDETVDQFVTRLRKLSVTCEFADLNKELKSAVIQHCKSKQLRRWALREEDLTLDKLTSKARALEASEQQAKGMEESMATSETVHRLGQRSKKQLGESYQGKQALPQNSMSSNQCRKCGLNWPHTNGPCPAAGKICRACGKPNHFAKMCLSKRAREVKPTASQGGRRSQVHQVRVQPEIQPTSSNESSDDEYLFTLGRDGDKKVPKITVTVNGVPIDMMIDTGASTNIMDEAAFVKLEPMELQPTTSQIFSYGSDSRLSVLGKFQASVKAHGKTVTTTIHVVPGAHGSLLSYTTAVALGVVDVRVNAITIADQMAKKFPDVFDGIGKLRNFEVKLHIDQSVRPVAQPARRIPFHLRKKVEAELDKLEEQGIIERVDGPTPWISPLVVIPKKSGEIRLCIDMRMANKAILRERHPTLTVEEITHALNGATVFSKLDLRSGYHQLPLAPESRYITTFTTHKGLRRYTRLNFGTNSASELFQHVISEQIRDIPGVLNVSDDLIVFGTTQQAHDQALEAVVERFASIGLTLNRKKCEISKSSLPFFGFVYSQEGVSLDPTKVKAIQKAQTPSSASDVRSFLGMATFCAKFIPNFSDVTKPLRELTKKNIRFCWHKEHQQAFDHIKELLTSDTVMAYFDRNKATELITDASPWGLSAILAQRTPGCEDDRKIVAFVSRSLSAVEQRYSQTEKEALAIVWAVERLHLYLCGGHFTLITDCKPIELILSNPKSKPPARIERWNLRLQEYNFTVAHTKGVDNPSDFLSRHPCPDTSKHQEKAASAYVSFISAHAVPKAMSIDEIKEATKEDITLQRLVQVIRSGKQTHADRFIDLDADQVVELKLLIKIRHELTVEDDGNIILKGTKIVLPSTLRSRAIKIAHEGHQGIVKTKQLLREKVWFPGIDKEVQRVVGECMACQANGID